MSGLVSKDPWRFLQASGSISVGGALFKSVKNWWTLSILESHISQQVRRVHRYKRHDHKITRFPTRVWFLTPTGEEEKTVLIHWRKYCLVTGDWWLPTAAARPLIDFPGWSVNTEYRATRFLQQATATRINQTRAGPDSYTRNKSLCCAELLRLEDPSRLQRTWDEQC